MVHLVSVSLDTGIKPDISAVCTQRLPRFPFPFTLSNAILQTEIQRRGEVSKWLERLIGGKMKRIEYYGLAKEQPMLGVW